MSAFGSGSGCKEGKISVPASKGKIGGVPASQPITSGANGKQGYKGTHGEKPAKI